MEVELQLRPQSVEPDLSQSSALSSAHAVESQFGRPVQLYQFKPNTHPSLQINYPWRFMFSFNLEMKGDSMKEEDNHFSLSCVFNWKVLLDELSTGSTIIHNLDERKTLALAISRLCTPLRCPSTFTDVYWVTRRSLITHCTDSCGKESGSSSSQPLTTQELMQTHDLLGALWHTAAFSDKMQIRTPNKIEWPSNTKIDLKENLENKMPIIDHVFLPSMSMSWKT